MNEEKELVWLPKELAEQIKDLKDPKVIEREVIKFITESKGELKEQLEALDEDALIYRGLMAKAKQSFRETYETHSSETYQLWEDFHKNTKQTKDFVASATDLLAPLLSDLKEVDKLMKSIYVWDVEKILSLLREVNSASEETKNMLRFLMENFQREQS